MIRILHINEQINFGGGEAQLIDVIPELNKYAVNNIVCGVSNSALQKECKKNNIDFYHLESTKLYSYRLYKSFHSLVTSIQPDIIHLHTSFSVSLYRLYSSFYKNEINAIISKKVLNKSSNLISKFKYNYKYIDRYICISDAIRKSFIPLLSKRNKNKAVVIHDGVNIERLNKINNTQGNILLGLDSNLHILLNVANHTKPKDLPTLLYALHYLVYTLNVKEVHLFQIGKHNSQITKNLEALIDELNIKSYITMLGYVEDPQQFYYLGKLFVMTSKEEGLSMAILEAMYFNLPIVTTRAGGIPEAVLNENTGLLSNVSDFKSIAENIKKLLLDEDRRVAYGKNAHERVIRNFTTEIEAKKIYNEYIKTINYKNS